MKLVWFTLLWRNANDASNSTDYTKMKRWSWISSCCCLLPVSLKAKERELFDFSRANLRTRPPFCHRRHCQVVKFLSAMQLLGCVVLCVAQVCYMRLEMTSICSCSFDIHNNYCHYYYCADLFLIRLIFLGYVVLQLVRLLYWQAMQCGDMWGWETEINRRQRTNDSVYYPIRRQRKRATDSSSSISVLGLCTCLYSGLQLHDSAALVILQKSIRS